VIENDESGFERAGGDLRRFERNRVLATVDDQGGNRNTGERRRQVEVTEAVPDALLHPPNDAERREVLGTRGVGEVPGHAELEAAVTVRVRIALAESGVGQINAHPLDDRSLLAS